MQDIHGYFLRTEEGDILITSEELDDERYESIAISHDTIGTIEVDDEVMDMLNEESFNRMENISPDPDYPINIAEIDDIYELDEGKFQDLIDEVYILLNDIYDDNSWDEDYDPEEWGED